jgi:hypothetical protein
MGLIIRARMRTMKSWVAITLLWAGAIAFSQDLTSVTLQRISNAKVFAFGGIGFAGTTSEGEKDFKIIMALPTKEAIIAFERLYATGNAQAKSYALAGIRKLDETRFDGLLTSVRASELKVQTESGCIVSERPLREVAMDLKSGKYDHWIR